MKYMVEEIKQGVVNRHRYLLVEADNEHEAIERSQEGDYEEHPRSTYYDFLSTSSYNYKVIEKE